jgi:hypothetical protein
MTGPKKCGDCKFRPGCSDKLEDVVYCGDFERMIWNIK